MIVSKSVELYNGKEMMPDHGEVLEASAFIRAAGVTGSEGNGLTDGAVSKPNRILVDRYCRFLTSKNISVVGDNDLMQIQRYPNGHPMMTKSCRKDIGRQDLQYINTCIPQVFHRKRESFKYYSQSYFP